MTARNIPFRKGVFCRVFAIFFIFIFVANSVSASSNFSADVLATAGVRVAPPISIAVTVGQDFATVEWTASPHAVSGSIDSYRIYSKLSTSTDYSDCPPSAEEVAEGKNCSVEYSFSTDASEQFSLAIENLIPENYDFIVRAVKNVGGGDFDSALHESSLDCASCGIQNVAITGEIPDDPLSSSSSSSGGGESEEPSLPSSVEPIRSFFESKFTDISNDDWFVGFVENLKNNGTIDGHPDGSFRPNAEINRAEITKIALAAFHPDADLSIESAFPDVPADEWFAPFVATAEKFAIVDGYPDGFFRPANFITRAEAVKILVNAAGFEIDSVDSQFVDVFAEDWFAPFVVSAESRGVVGGYSVKIPAFEFTDKLRIGVRGDDVGALQFLLCELGFYRGVTSFAFGGVTQRALINFQFANLKIRSFQIGVLDEITKNKIYELTKINLPRVVRKFRPANFITRAEVAKIVSILLDLKNDGYSLDATIATSFDDSPIFDLSKVEFEEPFVATPILESPTTFTSNSVFEKLENTF